MKIKKIVQIRPHNMVNIQVFPKLIIDIIFEKMVWTIFHINICDHFEQFKNSIRYVFSKNIK